MYHPKHCIITTPSYTYNARFTTPTAPAHVRKGFKDPTGRTNRIFRHDDHKFEWTIEEFAEWCTTEAQKWGYKVHLSDIGRAVQVDEFGRDEQLGGASLVAEFTRESQQPDKQMESRARELIASLKANEPAHELLAQYTHQAHSAARKPEEDFSKIGDQVKACMEKYRESFMRLEELWFEHDISTLCGGWIEFLVRAVEEHEGLILKRDVLGRENWLVELAGGMDPAWAEDSEHIIPHMSPDWLPVEDADTDWGSDEARWGEDADASSEAGGQTVAWGEEDEDDDETANEWNHHGDWSSTPNTSWEHTKDDESWSTGKSTTSTTTGWDVDEGQDTKTR